jgi:vanillate O-demethylase ferredoxin subunit
MDRNDLIDVVVASITDEATDIRAFELRRRDGGELPPFAAGAHVDVHLPGNIVRAYSLCNAQGERDRYVVAVARSATSRGGSSCMHGQLVVGSVLRIGAPRNHFALVEEAPHTVLIAGGIGITPIWCMAQRLQELGRSWELVYSARTRAHAAFLAQLSAPGIAGKVRFHFAAEAGGRVLDLARVISEVPAAAHLYCCGPLPMLDAFEQATAQRAPGSVHLERFSAKDAPADEGGFRVKLARSGKLVLVGRGQTVLEALLQNDVNPPYSCMEGTCGECLTTVLEGLPDHRDGFLSPAEQAANNQMTICCSGARSECLVLDL